MRQAPKTRDGKRVGVKMGLVIRWHYPYNRPMPNASKLSRQGANGALSRAAKAARIAELAGTWCHANAYAEAGCPAPYLLEGVPVAIPDVYDVTPSGALKPRERLLAAIVRAGRADVLEANPAYVATLREMSPGTATAVYCEMFGDGAPDAVGVANYVFTGYDKHGRERRTLAVAGNGQCATGSDRYKRQPKNRTVALTTGGGEASMPEGARRAMPSEVFGQDVGGLYVMETTPEPPKRKRGSAGKGAKARRAARRAQRSK